MTIHKAASGQIPTQKLFLEEEKQSAEIENEQEARMRKVADRALLNSAFLEEYGPPSAFHLEQQKVFQDYKQIATKERVAEHTEKSRQFTASIHARLNNAPVAPFSESMDFLDFTTGDAILGGMLAAKIAAFPLTAPLAPVIDTLVTGLGATLEAFSPEAHQSAVRKVDACGQWIAEKTPTVLKTLPRTLEESYGVPVDWTMDFYGDATVLSTLGTAKGVSRVVNGISKTISKTRGPADVLKESLIKDQLIKEAIALENSVPLSVQYLKQGMKSIPESSLQTKAAAFATPSLEESLAATQALLDQALARKTISITLQDIDVKSQIKSQVQSERGTILSDRDKKIYKKAIEHLTYEPTHNKGVILSERNKLAHDIAIENLTYKPAQSIQPVVTRDSKGFLISVEVDDLSNPQSIEFLNKLIEEPRPNGLLISESAK